MKPINLTKREEAVKSALTKVLKDVTRNYRVNYKLYKASGDPLVREGGYRASEELRPVKRALQDALRAFES